MKTGESNTTLTDPILRLAEYWLSARLMHDHVHEIKEAYFRLNGLKEDGLFHEFHTYVSFWLSALFVVSEGYIELGLSDHVLDPLIERHIESLRLYRNATFHFQRKPDKHVQFYRDPANRLNWAEELHASLEDFFLRHVQEPENAGARGPSA